MGLAAPKRRNKLSHDPNNTAWSKSDNGYGHRILSAHGWKPGDYLGAENATHSDHFTAANASHIRILLREDNLGLGAQLGKGNAETFGLSVFSGVLGRLNGKSDAEVQKQQNAFRDAELRSYQVNKYGFMNFVRGGLLVGDQIKPVQGQDPSPRERETTSDPSSGEEGATKKRKRAIASTRDKDSKKAKKIKSKRSSEQDQDQQQIVEHSEMRSKKRRRRERETSRVVALEVGSSHELELDVGSGSEDNVEGGKASKKRDRRDSKREKSEAATTTDATADTTSESKHEKRARKEERRKRKEEKRRSKSDRTNASHSTGTSGNEMLQSPGTNSLPTSGNRHAVRQRYIQQKRMAAMDPQAMREIFMLTGTA